MEALLWSWRRREFVSGGEFILQNQVTVVLFAMSHLEQLPPSSLPAGRRDHYMLFIDTHEEFSLHFVVPCLCHYGRVDRTLLIPTFTTNVTVSLCPFCLWHSFCCCCCLCLFIYLTSNFQKHFQWRWATQTWTTRTTGSTLWVRASSHLFRKGSDHNDNNGDRKPWGSATVTCRSVNYSAFGFGFSFCAFA